ncbi:hypothetical protein BBJ28_00004400 [Nothophytophthora sp. Chile5]|nr:hypothetical protein BBJ28_00004400 [Nothophytophthora sp. Chile5]
MENAQLPPSSLLIDSDDCVMLEAALSFIDGCSDLPSGSEGEALGDASPSEDFVPDFVADLDRIGNLSPTGPTLDCNSDDDASPNTWEKSVVVSKPTRRYRLTPKQEIEQLRVQELQLSRQLEQLRLQAHDSAQYVGGARLRATLPFWKKAASRQYQSRQDSQRENRRLRLLVSTHKKRAKRLQQAWRKLIEPEDAGHPSKTPDRISDPSETLVSPDTLDVLIDLTAEADGIYANLDQFLAGRWQQQDPTQEAFIEHSASHTVPFDRQAVVHATWRALEARFGAHKVGLDSDSQRSPCFLIPISNGSVCCGFCSCLQQVQVTKDTLTSCAHRVLRMPNMSVYLQIRLVGRKYREADRTVIVTRALVEPQHLEGRASVGFCFRETEVNIIASSQELSEGVSVDHSAVATTIETHAAVNTHATGDGEAMRWWKASVGGHVARNLWQQAFAVRVNSIDDLLFEETRKL